MDIARTLLGMAMLLLIAFAVSNNRRLIKPRVVIAALLTQIAIGAFILFVPIGVTILAGAAHAVNVVLEFGNKGIEFMFGGLVTPKMFELFGDGGFLFAFRVLPAIIFVTAFDRFAIEAFDLEAVDYLLKPVAADRLARAIARVIERRSGAVSAPGKADYTQEFWVPYRSELIRIAASDIERIDAERDYMRLGLGQRSYLLHQTIAALEARLDPAQFIRLHRSVIVRRDRIKALGHDRGGAWYAELVDGEQVRIGRTYLANAKLMAGRSGV